MRIKELREKSKSELQKMLQDSRSALSNLNFNVSSKQLKNVRKVRSTKKLIARILTLLKEETLSHKP